MGCSVADMGSLGGCSCVFFGGGLHSADGGPPFSLVLGGKKIPEIPSGVFFDFMWDVRIFQHGTFMNYAVLPTFRSHSMDAMVVQFLGLCIASSLNAYPTLRG